MDLDFALVSEKEGDPPTELPLESDGTLLLSTVEAQFPGASGIKFINPKSGAPRGVRLAEGKFHPPDQKEGFGDHVYFCVFPKGGAEKRKLEEEPAVEEPTAKVVKKIVPKTTDLIVLGIPWETTDATLKSYFQDNFGEVLMAQVKTSRNGKSRGFGFVRFADYEVQKKALGCRHQIDGRFCDVSLPPSAKMGSSKVFVGRLTSALLDEDLRQYFSTLGEVTDCFVPKPFRGFGFVTFMDPAVAKVACEMTNHEVKGVSVHVETASPKPNRLQPGPKQANGRQGGIRDRLPDRRRPTANRWDDQDECDYGGRGGDRYERGGDINRSPWNKGSAGFGGGGREEGFGDVGAAGINLRGVSPDRLINAIKDAGLASALGIGGGGSIGGGGGGYSSSRGGFADDPFDRYRGGTSSRYENDSPVSGHNSWKPYDRYSSR